MTAEEKLARQRLDVLFIASAGTGLSPDELRDQPLAGDLFGLKPAHAGSRNISSAADRPPGNRWRA